MRPSAPCHSLLRTPLLRTGTIIDYAPQSLIVEILAKESCEQCVQGRGCGVGLLARQRSQRIAVALPAKSYSVERCYPLGNQVTISLPRASVTLLAFFVYAPPLLLALLLSGMASLVSATLWLAPTIFFIALVGGALSVKCLLRGRRERFRPRLVS